MNRLLRIFAVTLSLVCIHHTAFAICEKYADNVVAERIKPKPGMTLIQTPAQIRSGLERQIQSDASSPDKSFLNKLISDYKGLRGIDPSKGLDTAAEMAFLLMRVCAYGGDAEAVVRSEASQPSGNLSSTCKAEIERAIEFQPNRSSELQERVKNTRELSKKMSKSELTLAIEREKADLGKWQSSQHGSPAVISLVNLDLCLMRAAMNESLPTGDMDSGGRSAQRQDQKNSKTQQSQTNQSQSEARDSQQMTQSSQQSAQQNQSRADQQRQGKRKTNDPAAQAHECIEIDKAGSGNFGAFKNACNFKVNFFTCNYKPRTIQGGFNWSADFDCEKKQFGLHTPDGGRSVAAHNRNTEMVYWFACKAPATPVDAAFVVGKGIEARCHN